ncbi:hypothetical protein PULV_a3872 [Pseudoalteromonas ulvae UL12]|uniref:VpsP family polysaccharide biosynthesis protein n=1 Tax=Pseudoalteromonas ulvae TaxID=107327 RepID=UPI00186B7BD0|nr:VpsP family polysaccharide biosynthesis protein [Pseudoalteromonas ulvae]MBE0363246.1 hypothetical protein [Pseudoalteromonas ulvae UL12]
MKNKIVIAFLMLATLSTMVFAFSWGMANVWYFSASYELDEWTKKGSIQTQADYESAYDAIAKAVAYDPTHPHYLHMQGRIVLWGINDGFVERARIDEVKALYLASTQQRASWPIPWIDLAYLNNAEQGLNQETWSYIDQALLVGPFEHAVTQGVLEIMLTNWGTIEPSRAPLFFEHFAVAAKQPKILKAVLVYAVAVGRKNLVCSQLKFDKEYKAQKESWLYKKYCRA